MKRILLLVLILLCTLFVSAQKMRTENYELYLLNLEENVLKISNDMNMTDKDQSYYEGTIQVIYMDTGEEKKYSFFFSTWNDKYKEFIIKDSNSKIVKPKISFNDKTTACLTGVDGEISTELKDNSNIDNSILSSMIIWLDNQVVN